jgi:hypothetical protein
VLLLVPFTRTAEKRRIFPILRRFSLRVVNWVLCHCYRQKLTTSSITANKLLFKSSSELVRERSIASENGILSECVKVNWNVMVVDSLSECLCLHGEKKFIFLASLLSCTATAFHSDECERRRATPCARSQFDKMWGIFLSLHPIRLCVY